MKFLCIQLLNFFNSKSYKKKEKIVLFIPALTGGLICTASSKS